MVSRRSAAALVGFALALSAAVSIGNARAAPDARVAVLFAAGERPPATFVEALRIQLARLAAVDVGPPLAETALPARVAEAGRVLEARGATLAVWLEATPPEGGAPAGRALYLVGRRAGRALIDVAASPAEGDPESSRALALKTRAVLLTVLGAAEDDGLARALAPPSAPAPADEEQTAAALAPVVLVVEAAGIVHTRAGSSDARGGGAFALGAALRAKPAQGELVATLAAVNGVDVIDPRGTLAASEIDVGFGVRALYRAEYLALGLELAVDLRVARTRGESPVGKVGDETRVVPRLYVAPDLRLVVAPLLSVRAAAGVEVGLVRQRWLVNDEALLDFGTVGGFGVLGLHTELPP
ncbi:MAG: hypothetical protein HY908_35555 [Myxococcales bacterium]|nr:hypothetical protein [Myxococcales bacterium]